MDTGDGVYEVVGFVNDYNLVLQLDPSSAPGRLMQEHLIGQHHQLTGEAQAALILALILRNLGHPPTPQRLIFYGSVEFSRVAFTVGRNRQHWLERGSDRSQREMTVSLLPISSSYLLNLF